MLPLRFHINIYLSAINRRQPKLVVFVILSNIVISFCLFCSGFLLVLRPACLLLTEGHKKQCDRHNTEGLALCVCMYVCLCWLGWHGGWEAWSTHNCLLFAWVAPSHIQKTHNQHVTPHPAKPALTVLSHHIWGVLTGDATGQSTATWTRLLQPRPSLLSFSPLLPFLPAYHVRI